MHELSRPAWRQIGMGLCLSVSTGFFVLLYSGIQAVRGRPVGVFLMIGAALLVVGVALGVFSALIIRAEENSSTAEVVSFSANDTPSSEVAA